MSVRPQWACNVVYRVLSEIFEMRLKGSWNMMTPDHFESKTLC